jgi:hypothetical protein
VVESSGDLVQPDYATSHSSRDVRSVKELVEKIDQYVQTANSHAQPFVWSATTESIFAKVQRPCERISGTGHQLDLEIVASSLQRIADYASKCSCIGKRFGLLAGLVLAQVAAEPNFRIAHD